MHKSTLETLVLYSIFKGFDHSPAQYDCRSGPTERFSLAKTELYECSKVYLVLHGQ